MSLASVTYLLQRHKLRPNALRGQNFLISDLWLEKLIEIAELRPEEKVIEIGAGIGNLTLLLAAKSRRVVAVEVDPAFKPILDVLAGVHNNLHPVYADILRYPFESLARDLVLTAGDRYKIIANIPYYLTGHLLPQVLTYEPRPSMIVLMLQKEVAQRIVAANGKHSKLSLGIHFYGLPEIAAEVSRKNFYPQPDVDSAILKLTDLHAWQASQSEKRVWQLIRIGFSSKRKKLLNNIAGGLKLDKETVIKAFKSANISSDIRSEDMTMGQWLVLADSLDFLS